VEKLNRSLHPILLSPKQTFNCFMTIGQLQTSVGEAKYWNYSSSRVDLATSKKELSVGQTSIARVPQCLVS
jgi:hypothetical protein